jgi:hypothetical protein
LRFDSHGDVDPPQELARRSDERGAVQGHHPRVAPLAVGVANLQLVFSLEESLVLTERQRSRAPRLFTRLEVPSSVDRAVMGRRIVDFETERHLRRREGIWAGAAGETSQVCAQATDCGSGRREGLGSDQALGRLSEPSPPPGPGGIQVRDTPYAALAPGVVLTKRLLAMEQVDLGAHVPIVVRGHHNGASAITDSCDERERESLQ